MTPDGWDGSVHREAYETAFKAYLRGGFSALSPADRQSLVGTDDGGGFLVPPDVLMRVFFPPTQDSIRADFSQVQVVWKSVLTWPEFPSLLHHTHRGRIVWCPAVRERTAA